MERNDWLERNRSHVASAQGAATPGIRLIHLDLAARYGVKAGAEGGLGTGTRGELPVADGHGAAGDETRVGVLAGGIVALQAGRPASQGADQARVHLSVANRSAPRHRYSAPGAPRA